MDIKNDDFINQVKEHWYAYQYDQHENFTEDVDLLLDLIGQSPKNILEVCCGTGRVLVPLAKAGHHVTGMDANEGMLNRISAKAKGLSNIKVSLANALTTEWGNDYDAVVLACNSLMNMEHRDDDKAAQQHMIRKAADALVPGGRFFIAFNHYPEPEKSFDFDGHMPGAGVVDDVGVSGRFFNYGGRYDPVTRIAVGASHLELTLPNGDKHIFPTHWHTYVCTREDVHHWLKDSGFVIEEEFGGCDRSPFTGGTGWDILWARKGRQ